MQKILLISLLVAATFAAQCAVPWLGIELAICLAGVPLCDGTSSGMMAIIDTMVCPILMANAVIEQTIIKLVWSMAEPMLAQYSITCVMVNDMGGAFITGQFPQCGHLL